MTDERIVVPIPESVFPTRIEVHYQGELNRHGGVQPGTTEAKIKLPKGATLEECVIRVIPCRENGQPASQGYIFQDDHLRPYREGVTVSPAYPQKSLVEEVEINEEMEASDESDECDRCESDETVCEDESCSEDQDSTDDEVEPRDEAEAVLERPVDDQIVEDDDQEQ